MLDRRPEVAVAGQAALEGEAKVLGGGRGTRGELRIVCLGEIDETAVVAEVERQQLRMAIQAKAGQDDRLELAGQEVGQVERADLVVL